MKAMAEIIKSFLVGIGTITLWPEPLDIPNVTDSEALQSDWEGVGKDLRIAMERETK